MNNLIQQLKSMRTAICTDTEEWPKYVFLKEIQFQTYWHSENNFWTNTCECLVEWTNDPKFNKQQNYKYIFAKE